MNFQSTILDLPSICHGFGFPRIAVEKHVAAYAVQTFPTKQVHSHKVYVVTELPQAVIEADAFVTNVPGIVCSVRTADCVPILLADPVKRVVGAVHAGWRGTAADIVGEAITVFQRRFGSQLEDLCVAIGPAICGNCYQVGEDVARAMGMLSPDAVKKQDEKYVVDLKLANRDRLRELGVLSEQIWLSKECTFCGQGNLASFRRDQTTERQENFIFIER
ncbi:MAG: peptidoglycan editing factor PgeF [Deltaproteobacteria bacterium]|nr:peptidoglycan editing factor PgeF [Deltaproteobacteria bacterium]